MDNIIPSKFSSTRFHQPWITTNIKHLSKCKQRVFNKARASGSPSDWSQYKSLKKITQQACREAHRSYILLLIDPIAKSNNKNLWSYIKSKQIDHTGVPPLFHNGRTITDSKEKANTLINHFSSVFTDEDVYTVPTLNNNSYPDIQPIIIQVLDVYHHLTSLQSHKAPGPDNIPPMLLKIASSEISLSLTLIFNASIHQGQLPYDRKQANVVPVFKKGSRAQPTNYRPISLTSVICKTLERIIHAHILSHLNYHNILCDQQHGFRPKRSCESQLITTINDIAKTLDAGFQTDVIFLDLSKAFDKVPHHRLCAKLKHYGIRGPILTWIHDFLSNRHHRVILDGNFSDIHPVISGVPQGTILAPLLFLVYINDLPTSIKCNVRLYADDAMLYSTIHTLTDCISLQQDLNTLFHWATTWNMSFNPDKCEYMKITLKHNTISYNYTMSNAKIKEVSTAKYLGVTINNHLTWSNHIDNICHKALSVKSFLQCNLTSCPPNIKLLCYITMVRSILEYASPVWSP